MKKELYIYVIYINFLFPCDHKFYFNLLINLCNLHKFKFSCDRKIQF